MASRKTNSTAASATKAADTSGAIKLAIRLVQTAHDQIDSSPAQAKTLLSIVLEGLTEALGGAK